MPKIKRPTIIYWLFDIRPETLSFWPIGLPFYCGKTIKTETMRLYEHKSDARRRPDREHSKRLLECGEHIDIRVIETVPPDGSWITRECHWIAHLRASFPGGTNIADGGEGGAGGGRPALGFKSVIFRLLPETVVRIRRVIRLKKKEKNISEYVRTALDEQLAEDEKDLGID